MKKIFFAMVLLIPAAASAETFIFYDKNLAVEKLPDDAVVIEPKTCKVLGRYIQVGGTSTPITTEFITPSESDPQPCEDLESNTVATPVMAL